MSDHSPKEDVKSFLLIVDGLVNLLFGIVLLLYPIGLPTLLGLPTAGSAFYPMIMGAVLFGIGLALLVEHRRGAEGLGFRGAIAINVCGGGAVLLWLLFGDLEIPRYGMALLWLVALSVLGLALAEWRRL